MNLPHLFSRIFGTPLAIHPAKFDAIIGGIGQRFNVDATEAQLEAAAKSLKATAPGKDYALQNNVAVISVSNTLMKKTYGLMAASGCSSYEGIAEQVQSAMDSPSVKGILLDIDSPGGETSGLFELCDTLTALRGQKPIYAVSDDAAYSAAYAIACCADKIYLTRTAGVGSIGVICGHVDQSQADAKEGLKYTFIHAGDKKTDGNPHQPLSETALNDSQAEVDRQYAMFTGLVAKNRNTTNKAIVSTQAGTYHGENAIPLLADKLGTFQDALADLQAAIDAPTLRGASALLNNSDIKTSGSNQAASIEDLPNMKAELNIDEVLAATAKAETDESEMKDCATKKADVDDGDEDDTDDKKKKDDEDVDAKAKATATAKAEVTHIVNLCSLAGMPELAATFLANDYTATEVGQALLKHRATKSKQVKISSGSTKTAGTDFAATAKEIISSDSITNKAEAYKKALLANPGAYLDSMRNRKHGAQYNSILK